MFLAWLLAALVAAPLAAVALHLLLPRVDVWRHLADTILWELTWNTAWLLVAVALGADTRHRPRLARGHPPLSGQRFFEWALMQPLAVPAYTRI